MATQAVIRGTPLTPPRYISIYPLKNIGSKVRMPIDFGRYSRLPDMKPGQEVIDV